MAIEVFIRTMNYESKFRLALYEATYQRWLMEGEKVRIVTLRDIGIREGRMLAESSARSDPYIYADDDVLPHGKNWIETGTRALLDNPEYAIASTLSLIEGENAYRAPEGVQIYDVHWVGAPMWIRKGILGPDLPEMTLGSECGVIDTYVRAKGYKEGLIAGIRHLNMGHGFSTDPNQQWGM